MPTTEAEPLSAAGVIRYVALDRGDDQGLATLAREREVDIEAWNRFIDFDLVEWGCDSSSLEDDDFVPPSQQTIDLAVKFARAWRDGGEPAPLRVLPDGDFGIAFEWRWGDLFQSLHLDGDGSAELDTFYDCRLVDTTPARLPF